MNKRTLLLSALLLTAAVLAACGGDTGDKVADTTAAGNTTTAPVETEPLFDDEMPERNMDGFTLTFMNYTDTALGWALKDINKEAENADQVNDAIFSRNRRIEERYNAVIDEFYMDELNSTFTNSVMAGTTDFDVAQIWDQHVNILNTAGVLLTWDNLPMVNLEKEWWNQDANEVFRIHDAQYAAAGDYNLSEYSKSYLYFFNKDLYHKLAYDENLYDLVREGKWTWDTMLKIAKDAGRDLNGDGVMDENDQYGLVETAKIHFQLLITGAGYKYIELDNDGVPYFAVPGNDGLISLMQKLIDDHIDTSWYYKSATPNGGVPNEVFEKGNSLFVSSTMWDTEDYRDYDFDIGLLPAPKWDEAQENYYSITIGGLVSVLPKTMPDADAENIGILLESLAADSRYTCLPAYKEVTLQSKYARDEGSADMIDIIFDSQTYDLGVTVWGDVVRSVLSEQLFQKLDTNVVSRIEKMEKTVAKQIESTMKALEED